jgi:uncharacterized membrane protein
MNLDKKVKKMDTWDVGLTKLSVAVAVLFIITIWSGAMDWVNSVNPWYFLIAFIIFAIRPIYRVYIK